MTEQKDELQDSLQPDEQVEETTEEVDEVDVDVDESTDDTEQEESYDSESEVVKSLKEKNKQLFERAKKAEAEAKKAKSKPSKPNSTLTRDEAILIAKGYEDEDLSILKTLQAGKKAQGEDLSLTELIKDPLYEAYVERREAKKKSEEAQLRASGSSKAHVNKKPMTPEEHQEFAAKKAKEMFGVDTPVNYKSLVK